MFTTLAAGFGLAAALMAFAAPADAAGNCTNLPDTTKVCIADFPDGFQVSVRSGSR